MWTPADEKQVLHDTIYQLEKALAFGVVQSSHFYPYIPLPLVAFCRLLDKGLAVSKKLRGLQQDPPPVRYLEVGCGVGTKLFLAMQSRVAEVVHGLEINEAYAAAAEKVMSRSRCNYVGCDSLVIRCDARNFDRYGDYNLFYTWSPMQVYDGSGGNFDLYRKIFREAPMYSVFLNFLDQVQFSRFKTNYLFQAPGRYYQSDVIVKLPDESLLKELDKSPTEYCI